MVVAVDSNHEFRQDPGKHGAKFNLGFVHRRRAPVFRPIVIKGPWKLFGHMGIECSTKAHIHYLAATADAEEWFVVVRGSPQETQLQRIPEWICTIHGWVLFSAIQADVDVAAAREQDAVKVRIEALPSRIGKQRWNHYGDAAGFQNRLNVGVRQKAERLVVQTAAASGRDTNYR